ncbi:hypothetical protein FQA39_LY08585 [Lamprigera yunnana]|nr:hypothetical protein FQA39_LY08585 [Lamprigera yunnana]
MPRLLTKDITQNPKGGCIIDPHSKNTAEEFKTKKKESDNIRSEPIVFKIGRGPLPKLKKNSSLELVEESAIVVINNFNSHNLNVSNRFKRKIFDGVSYVINWLFGIPDANDAEFYENSIKTLLQDNRQTQLLMKQQIGIVSNTISNFNSSIQNLKINEDKLNANIELFNTFSRDTTSSINEIRLQQIISEQINILSQMICEIDDFYNLLISSITLSRHNILHPQIITPLNLMNKLSKITLPSGHQFPIPLSYNTIYKYFEICQLNVIYVNQIIIFAIKISLVQKLQYDLYQMLSLPIPHNHSSLYSYIEPSSPYLMMSTTKVYYSLLQNLRKCRNFIQKYHICEDIIPKRTSETPLCETMLLTSFVSKIPSTCKTKSIQAELEIWNPIQNNQWIFAVTNPIQLTLTCNDSPIEDIKLSSTGIIRLHKGCNAYTTTHVLETTSEIVSTFLHKVPDFNIVNDECCIKKDNDITHQAISLKPIKITTTKLEELQIANHKLRQLDIEITKQLSEPINYQKTSSWYTSFFSFFGSFIGLVILYNLIKWCGLIRLFRRLLCCARPPKLPSDNCCAKIFNTNISGVPITQEQLSRIIQEENMELTQRTVQIPIVQVQSRTGAPSINMD